MEITLPLDQMTTAEKLRVMEVLWTDLTTDETQIDSPAWHGEVLNDRERKIQSGEEAFVDWETAKKNLRDRLT